MTVDPARAELALSFADPDVVAAYRHRPPYPAEVFDVLEHLIADQPRTVLDIGAGEGALARPLAARVDHVDALDMSAAMVAAGARRPGGRRANLRWIVGALETAELASRYALVTAGASLHWMAWQPTLARLKTVMSRRAVLAIVDHGHDAVPWRGPLAGVIARHSRSPGYDPGFSLPGELAARGLWDCAGRVTTSPVVFLQAVDDYVEHFHSTASLARRWMSAQEAAEFGQAVRRAVAPYAADGMLELQVVAEIAWGRPRVPSPV